MAMKISPADVLASGKKYVSYNILLQVSTRVISFLSNAVILRFISDYVFGVINVRLMLLYSTAHCLSRESFRRSCIGRMGKDDTRKIINLTWVSLPLSVIVSLLLRIVWLHLLAVPDLLAVHSYRDGVDTVLCCFCIETLAEPLFVLGVNFHFVKLKVFCEGLYHTTRSFCMAVLVAKYMECGISAFCISQALSSVLYAAAYYLYFWWYLSYGYKIYKDVVLPLRSIADIFPKFSLQFLEWETVVLTWSFFKQTLMKQLLTEGEKYVMTVFNVLSFSEQGVYEIVNNLGSLAARLIFLPIEESFYQIFASLLRRLPAKDQSVSSVNLSITVLQNVSKLMLLLGFTCFFFGFSYSQTLLYLYGGRSLSEGPAVRLLQWHSFYIMFIAVNGVTEAFVFAVMSSSQIDKRNFLTFFLSVTFLLLSYFLTALFGSTGFILANCVNMGLRIYFSLHFIANYFSEKSMKSICSSAIPACTVLAAYMFCFIVMCISEVILCCSHGFFYLLIHIAVGLCCLLLVLAIIYLQEQRLVKFIFSDWFKDPMQIKRD